MYDPFLKLIKITQKDVPVITLQKRFAVLCFVVYAPCGIHKLWQIHNSLSQIHINS